jgi:hypothetical protein
MFMCHHSRRPASASTLPSVRENGRLSESGQHHRPVLRRDRPRDLASSIAKSAVHASRDISPSRRSAGRGWSRRLVVRDERALGVHEQDRHGRALVASCRARIRLDGWALSMNGSCAASWLRLPRGVAANRHTADGAGNDDRAAPRSSTPSHSNSKARQEKNHPNSRRAAAASRLCACAGSTMTRRPTTNPGPTSKAQSKAAKREGACRSRATALRRTCCEAKAKGATKSARSAARELKAS